MDIVTEQRNKTLDLTLKNKAINFNLKNKLVLHFKNKNYLQLVETVVNDEEDFCLDEHKFENHNLLGIKRLNNTYKNVYNNTGTTCAYLIVNFIQWKNLYSRYTAPLILIPLTIQKKTSYDRNVATHKYFMSYSGEEITSNIVIEEKLKKDFGIKLPEFTGNYQEYFNAVEETLKNEMDVQLVKKTCLGSLIYNCRTFYNDYNEELWAGNFENNNIIKMLSKPPQKNKKILTNNSKDIPDLVCPADKYQISAVQTALDGNSFVIQGPPGTGKSQTIINIMSALASKNKRVLFVSEKESAIEVVKNRMNELGLGIFCLDIHDPKKTTKKIMEQIRLRESFKDYNKDSIVSKIKQNDIIKTFEKTNSILYSRIQNEVKNYSKTFIDYLKANIEYKTKDLRHVPKYNENYYEKINYSLILHETEKQQRFQPLSRFMSYSGIYLATSVPIWMMSPVSVSKLITRNIEMFDTLIMDEASQIYFENILGCVLRSKQVIVVGDSKQMSPNNILSTKKALSALDVFEKYLPSISLNVHYRSDSKSLIDFSNETYYDNKLNILPSISVENKLFEHYVENGYYTLLTNQTEAKQVVQFVKNILKKYYSLPEEKWDSIGIIAINTRQQELIEDILNEELTKDETFLDVYTKLNKKSSLFIKSLETVQGDERDVIIISMTYGINPHAKKIYQRFRQFNTEFGWKRLNVLASRARKEIHAFKSLKSTDVVAPTGCRQGVKDFKAFLERIETSNFNPVQFSKVNMKLFSDLGYDIYSNVGYDEYRLDYALMENNNFICGIKITDKCFNFKEVYHNIITIDVLKKKGWNIYEMNISDLKNNPMKEKQKLKEFIKNTCKCK